jgi:hypothetical protein
MACFFFGQGAHLLADFLRDSHGRVRAAHDDVENQLEELAARVVTFQISSREISEEHNDLDDNALVWPLARDNVDDFLQVRCLNKQVHHEFHFNDPSICAVWRARQVRQLTWPCPRRLLSFKKTLLEFKWENSREGHDSRIWADLDWTVSDIHMLIFRLLPQDFFDFHKRRGPGQTHKVELQDVDRRGGGVRRRIRKKSSSRYA